MNRSRAKVRGLLGTAALLLVACGDAAGTIELGEDSAVTGPATEGLLHDWVAFKGGEYAEPVSRPTDIQSTLKDFHDGERAATAVADKDGFPAWRLYHLGEREAGKQ